MSFKLPVCGALWGQPATLNPTPRRPQDTLRGARSAGASGWRASLRPPFLSLQDAGFGERGRRSLPQTPGPKPRSSPRRILFSLFYERGNEARKRRGTEAAPLTGAGLGVQPGASELLANRPPVVSIGGEPGGQSVTLSVRGQKRVCRASRCTCPHKRPQQRRECGSGACK